MGRRVPGSGGAAKGVLRRLSLPAIALLVSCQPGPQSTPTIPEADARAVQGFLRAYGRRDLDGMMRYL
ncbi:MAG TPA: hypothetical protein VJ486_14015, partial [Geothrix sp.]|nr:hypothetical protein [Geothrix sp.]